jgi:hypothetical protein
MDINNNIIPLEGVETAKKPLMKKYTWTTKSGEVKSGYIDNRPYIEKWRNNNKDKLMADVVCPICNITYKLNNSSHHKKTKIHLFALNFINKTNNNN